MLPRGPWNCPASPQTGGPIMPQKVPLCLGGGGIGIRNGRAEPITPRTSTPETAPFAPDSQPSFEVGSLLTNIGLLDALSPQGIHITIVFSKTTADTLICRAVIWTCRRRSRTRLQHPYGLQKNRVLPVFMIMTHLFYGMDF